MTRAMAVDHAHERIRVNTVLPGSVFLVSSLASYVTGAELRVDGGLLAGVALRAPGEEG